ncbi:hypothetical protein [Streptomyces sp. NPDC096339]|uniref:hypothetical protein n=1 Tax=Streptomyces sp. NPDC096339 TaxID=3366086 RepID=UPI00382088B7
MSSIAVPAVPAAPAVSAVSTVPAASTVTAVTAVATLPTEPDAAAELALSVVPTGLPRTELRGRIGVGFSPVPHRYHLFLGPDCPHSLRVAAALAALGLEGSVAATVLPAYPGHCAEAHTAHTAHTALRLAYEATGHHFDGTLTVPALVDGWSGRVVSNHTPGILDDLRFLGAHPAFRTAP